MLVPYRSANCSAVTLGFPTIVFKISKRCCRDFPTNNPSTDFSIFSTKFFHFLPTLHLRYRPFSRYFYPFSPNFSPLLVNFFQFSGYFSRYFLRFSPSLHPYLVNFFRFSRHFSGYPLQFSPNFFPFLVNFLVNHFHFSPNSPSKQPIQYPSI